MRRILLGALPAVLLGAAPLLAATVELAAAPRQLDRWGGWQDAFQTNVRNARLDDGDMGYRVFDDLGGGQTRHFVNGGRWMVDLSGGGAALSPNQTFHFENGKLVIEADVAAGVPGDVGPQGDLVWPEVVWSTAPAPTGKTADPHALYGQFGGQWAAGCRLGGGRGVVCALEADHTIARQGPCASAPVSRVLELSASEACGYSHSGLTPNPAWRQCQPGQAVRFCLDRFRFEWTREGVGVFVNGVSYGWDTGWPGSAQIPAAIAGGQVAVHVYFGEWSDQSAASAYRLSWGRLAVNPHDQRGSLLPPSAAPGYCRDQPRSTCAVDAWAAGGPGPSRADAHLFIASALNGGQQPAFWIVPGVLLAAAAAVSFVRWLWSVRPRRRDPGRPTASRARR